MRTETVTYQIFSLGELSPEARARAYRKWLNDEPEYGWNAENKQTLNAFCDLLGIRCNKWEYDGYSYSFSCYSPYEDTNKICMEHGSPPIFTTISYRICSSRKSTTKGEDAAEAAYSVRRNVR